MVLPLRYLQIYSELSYKDRGWCNHAQYCEDGRIVQEREAHVNFVSRALYGVSKYIGQQLPKEYDLIIDPDLFLKAFTYHNKEGRCISADIWELAPGHHRKITSHSGPLLTSSQTPATPQASSNELAYTPGPSNTIRSSQLEVEETSLDSIEFVSQDEIRKDARARYHTYA